MIDIQQMEQWIAENVPANLRTYARSAMLRYAVEHDLSNGETWEDVWQEIKRTNRNRRIRLHRAAMRDVYDSLGMKRVRGALGGTYYE